MKNLQLLYLLIMCSFGCSAQSTIPPNAKEILISKNWIVEGLEIDIYKITFTETKMTVSLNGTSVGNEEYYLSNNLNECNGGFIPSNVGYTTTGRYIITKNMCLELITLNSSKLITRSVKNNVVTTASPE